MEAWVRLVTIQSCLRGNSCTRELWTCWVPQWWLCTLSPGGPGGVPCPQALQALPEGLWVGSEAVLFLACPSGHTTLLWVA